MEREPAAHRFQRAAVLVLVIAVSALFFWMIRSFLIPLLLAAVFASLAYPLYRALHSRFRQRAGLASVATLGVLLLSVIVPLLLLFGLIAQQAFEVSEQVTPWVKKQIEAQQSGTLQIPEWIPFAEEIDTGVIVAKLGQLAETLGQVVLANLSAVSKGTAEFFLDLFIMLYAMYFLLVYASEARDRLLTLVPLSNENRNRLLDKGRAVARATIKGTVVIGIVQGILGGLAFFAAGLGGAALWGTVMALSSVIPGVGTALVWVPAVGYVFASGDVGWGIGLTVWFAAVVGTVDNVLRPKLVGSDTQMPDILILISTLGGLAMFGAAGLLIGPIIAGVWITLFDVYEGAFSDLLPVRSGAP